MATYLPRVGVQRSHRHLVSQFQYHCPLVKTDRYLGGIFATRVTGSKGAGAVATNKTSASQYSTNTKYNPAGIHAYARFENNDSLNHVQNNHKGNE